MPSTHHWPAQPPSWYRATKAAWHAHDQAQLEAAMRRRQARRRRRPPREPLTRPPSGVDGPDPGYLDCPQHTCSRCGHTWIGKNPVRWPRRCPACTSPYWNLPRVRGGNSRRAQSRVRPAALPLPEDLAMPLQGGQWQWPLEEPRGLYRLSPGARRRLRAAGIELYRRHPAWVYAVKHPLTPYPPLDLILVEAPVPPNWPDPAPEPAPERMRALRRFDEPPLRGEKPWTRWRPPVGVAYA
jgi:hypothetical protein